MDLVMQLKPRKTRDAREITNDATIALLAAVGGVSVADIAVRNRSQQPGGPILMRFALRCGADKCARIHTLLKDKEHPITRRLRVQQRNLKLEPSSEPFPRHPGTTSSGAYDVDPAPSPNDNAKLASDTLESILEAHEKQKERARERGAKKRARKSERQEGVQEEITELASPIRPLEKREKATENRAAESPVSDPHSTGYVPPSSYAVMRTPTLDDRFAYASIAAWNHKNSPAPVDGICFRKLNNGTPKYKDQSPKASEWTAQPTGRDSRGAAAGGTPTGPPASPAPVASDPTPTRYTYSTLSPGKDSPSLRHSPPRYPYQASPTRTTGTASYLTYMPRSYKSASEIKAEASPPKLEAPAAGANAESPKREEGSPGGPLGPLPVALAPDHSPPRSGSATAIITTTTTTTTAPVPSTAALLAIHGAASRPPVSLGDRGPLPSPKDPLVEQKSPQEVPPSVPSATSPSPVEQSPTPLPEAPVRQSPPTVGSRTSIELIGHLPSEMDSSVESRSWGPSPSPIPNFSGTSPTPSVPQQSPVPFFPNEGLRGYASISSDSPPGPGGPRGGNLAPQKPLPQTYTSRTPTISTRAQGSPSRSYDRRHTP